MICVWVCIRDSRCKYRGILYKNRATYEGLGSNKKKSPSTDRDTAQSIKERRRNQDRIEQNEQGLNSARDRIDLASKGRLSPREAKTVN